MTSTEETRNYENGLQQQQLMAPIQNPQRSLSTSTTYGRVVYLHFACRAPLPIGSFLRVTSSQLWAPGTLTPSDPTDAKNISVKANEVALPDNTVDGLLESGMGGQNDSEGVKLSYASSVEMVTSPEEWPIWRTRTPVVIALRHHHGRIEHHRYRYMVVTPGAEAGSRDEFPEQKEGEDEGGEAMNIDTDAGMGLGASTSGQNENNVGTQVMAWEDPFRESNLQSEKMSTVSLPSVRRQAISKTLANLPYRTIEIDTTTAQVKYQQDHSSIKEEDGHDEVDMDGDHNENLNLEFTTKGVQIDTWNKADDFTFCQYVLRNELNKQNKSKKKMISKYNSSMATVGSGMEEKTDDFDIDDNGTGMRSRVSFNHMIEISPSSPGEDDEIMDSTITSLTMTPKMSKSVISGTSSNRKKNRIFFVCFHLPVIVRKDIQSGQWNAVWAESLLAATEGSDVVKEYDCHWVGTVSCSAESEEEKDEIREVLAKLNCTPLFFDKKVKDDHYYGMCKQVLWPAFHNVDLIDLNIKVPNNGNAKTESAYRVSDWDQSRLDGWWQAYTLINTAFAETLSTMLQAGDIMWVHDYHLSLLPKMVDDMERSKNKGQPITKKVFLLHIPFPTSQVFRELECGEAILSGMLHADVVGFHAFDHARHFLKAAKRIFGLNYESLIGGLIGVQLGRRTVLVTMHNVSIEPQMVSAALSNPLVDEIAAKMRQDHASRKIIAGVDITQRLSGISLKLLAFDRLLSDYPVWQQSVTLVQKCLLPGSRLADEAMTIKEVRNLVSRIKEKFGPHVIDYEEISGSSLPIEKRLSLWKVADVLMVTPIREGLNLLPLEYVFTKKKPASPGVVISSEFSAVASVLNGALRVNPYDIQMTVTNIDKALTMSDDEREGRRIRDEGFVSSSTSSQWTQHVLDDLQDATTVKNGFISDNDSDDTSMIGSRFDKKDSITSTASYLAQEHEKGFSHLDMTSVVKTYRCTKKRVLLLDLNGTIVFKEPPGKYLKRDILGSSGMLVDPEVSKALRKLCSDPNTTVFVVSGDSQENVEKAIGDVRGVGIAASNGACFAPPLKDGETQRRWKFFDLGVDWEAVKTIVMPILAKYTARSNGSFIKLTHSSIGWSYYSCDPEWGSLQASHLVLELEQVLRAFDVRFVMIKGIVEIVPRRLNKGLIVKNVLREAQLRGDVDWVLCMGDDIQDEKMFTSVFSFLAELEDPKNIKAPLPVVDETGASIASAASMSDESHHSLGISLSNDSRQSKDKPSYAFTATVGKKESHALQYVDDANDVGALLKMLANNDTGMETF